MKQNKRIIKSILISGSVITVAYLCYVIALTIWLAKWEERTYSPSVEIVDLKEGLHLSNLIESVAFLSWHSERLLQIRKEAQIQLISELRDKNESPGEIISLCDETVVTCKKLGVVDLFPMEQKYRLQVIHRRFEDALKTVHDMRTWCTSSDFVKPPSTFSKGHFTAMLLALECHCWTALEQYAAATVAWHAGARFCHEKVAEKRAPFFGRLLVGEGYILSLHAPDALAPEQVDDLENLLTPYAPEGYTSLCKKWVDQYSQRPELPWSETVAYRRFGLIPPSLRLRIDVE